MEQKKIIYIGESDAFPVSVDELKKELSCKFKQIPFKEDFNSLLKSILKSIPGLILIRIEKVDNSLLNFLLLIKSYSKLANLRVIGLFSDKDSLNLYSDIFSFGMDYAIISGEEKDRIMSDFKCILSPDSAESIRFATAEQLDIPTKILFPAKISHISGKTFLS